MLDRWHNSQPFAAACVLSAANLLSSKVSEVSLAHLLVKVYDNLEHSIVLMKMHRFRLGCLVLATVGPATKLCVGATYLVLWLKVV